MNTLFYIWAGVVAFNFVAYAVWCLIHGVSKKKAIILATVLALVVWPLTFLGVLFLITTAVLHVEPWEIPKE